MMAMEEKKKTGVWKSLDLQKSGMQWEVPEIADIAHSFRRTAVRLCLLPASTVCSRVAQRWVTNTNKQHENTRAHAPGRKKTPKPHFKGQPPLKNFILHAPRGPRATEQAGENYLVFLLEMPS